jgi:hypothetical protein
MAMNWANLKISSVLNPGILKILDDLLGIKILMVTDGSGAHVASFGPGDPADTWFGLSEVLRTLHDTSNFITNFTVTRAHRDTDPGNFAAMSAADRALFKPNYENFRFDQHDLSQYHEIWLFGVGSSYETSPLTDAELAAIATFMDHGGGVFATGDHEDLGQPLCGRIPRVRSMRKWYYPSAGPLGEPVAPEALGADRYDTTMPGHDSAVTFDDQSDDVPQSIAPTIYSMMISFFTRADYPHPLLCGPNGNIARMPDHMHEGEVIVPWELDRTFTFAGHNFVEYPNNPGTGAPQVPEIVATSQVLRHGTPSTESEHTGDSTPTNPRTFGSIGAYDGHRAGVGRVAVDSTWHHFFDINLIGDPVAPAPKTQGFNASPAGQDALKDIQSYYRNIGVWLAPAGKLSALWSGMTLAARVSHPLNEVLRHDRDYTATATIQLGAWARLWLLRVIPDCAILDSLIPHFVDGPRHVMPWEPVEQRVEAPAVDPMLLADAALGGGVIALARELPLRGDLKEDPQKIIAAGVSKGFSMLATEIRRQSELLGKFADELGRDTAGRSRR